MISKSTKAKRRHNALFYKNVNDISVDLIDNRNGRNFYIISIKVKHGQYEYLKPGQYNHIECRGKKMLLSNYRTLLKSLRV